MTLALSPYNGKPLGLAEMSDGITIAPIVANRELLFLSDEGDLIAYR